MHHSRARVPDRDVTEAFRVRVGVGAVGHDGAGEGDDVVVGAAVGAAGAGPGVVVRHVSCVGGGGGGEEGEAEEGGGEEGEVLHCGKMWWWWLCLEVW